MIFQAHRGVNSENPENTLPAFVAAIEQGYKIIEADVAVTKDSEFVLLHDDTLNRTARCNDGSVISDTVKIADITYTEALEYDFGMYFSEKFKGTKIPHFKELLEIAEKNNVKIKIDNKYQNFNAENRKKFFELLTPYQDTACLTCSEINELESACEYFPKMQFHYDGMVNAENLERIASFLPKERLTVWLPLKCPQTSWVKVLFADETTAKLVKQYARLGIWILSDKQQLEEAEKLNADMIETSGQLKPCMRKGIRADMHTHSENSHDSICKIEDMYFSQIKKGNRIFAVTDHFDTASFDEYDIFTPIKTAVKTVENLNEKYGNENLILSGIEISEGFWHPQSYQKVMDMSEYDVIIGSVHLVKYKDLTCAYSSIDFTKLDKDTIVEYMDAYFDDVLTMTETENFDILAHLTCPIRYIKGKYNIDIDLACYEKKIDMILQAIIQKGIALEVNTSSFDKLNDFMPTIDILKKYHDMGGYLITLGSDAHVDTDAAKHFDEAIDTIKKIGFENIFFYKKRNPLQITI